MPIKDVIQEMEGKYRVPKIRVWCHPYSGGSDYYYKFKTINLAYKFLKAGKSSKKHRVEDLILIAYNGYEYSLDDLAKECPKIYKKYFG